MLYCEILIEIDYLTSALPVFGVLLEEAVQRSMLPDGIQIPRVIRECIMQIEDRGLLKHFSFGRNISICVVKICSLVLLF